MRVGSLRLNSGSRRLRYYAICDDYLAGFFQCRISLAISTPQLRDSGTAKTPIQSIVGLTFGALTIWADWLALRAPENSPCSKYHMRSGGSHTNGYHWLAATVP